MEIWKDIVGYEGLYQVSNLGNVKSCKRIVFYGNNKKQTIHEKILKPDINKLGYKRVTLCKYGKTKRMSIHRLVATAFVENPDNKPVVNHIDCNPSNNCVENLEWCTTQENNLYAIKLGRIKPQENGKKTTCKPVVATNITTGEMFYFESIREAQRQLNIFTSNINGVLKGKRNKTKGYTFKYLKED